MTPEALEKYSQLPVFWIILGILIIFILLPGVIEIWNTGGVLKNIIGSPKNKFRKLINKNKDPSIKSIDIILSSFNEQEFDYESNYPELFNCKWFYNNKYNNNEEASLKIVGGDCIYITGRIYDIPEHYYGFKIFKIVLNKTNSSTIFIDITKGKFLPKMLEEIYKISNKKNVVVLYNNKQNEIIEVVKLLKSQTTNTNVEFRNYDRYNIIYKKS